MRVQPSPLRHRSCILASRSSPRPSPDVAPFTRRRRYEHRLLPLFISRHRASMPRHLIVLPGSARRRFAFQLSFACNVMTRDHHDGDDAAIISRAHHDAARGADAMMKRDEMRREKSDTLRSAIPRYDGAACYTSVSQPDEATRAERRVCQSEPSASRDMPRCCLMMFYACRDRGRDGAPMSAICDVSTLQRVVMVLLMAKIVRCQSAGMPQQ